MDLLRELLNNYQKLSNVIQMENHLSGHHVNLKLMLIDHKVKEINAYVESLYFDILNNHVLMSEDEINECENIDIVNNTMDILAPYAIYLNLCQSCIKKKRHIKTDK
jgi:hypothetical protein